MNESTDEVIDTTPAPAVLDETKATPDDKPKAEAEAPAPAPADIEAETPKQSRFQRRISRERAISAKERERADDAEAKLASMSKADPERGGPQMGEFESFDEYEVARKAWAGRKVEEKKQGSAVSVESAAAEFVAQLDEWDDAPEGAVAKIRSNDWSPTEMMVTTMIELDNGPETALWLSEHPKTVKRLSNMPDKRQEQELWKIATRIEDNGKIKPAAPAKPADTNALSNPPTGASDGQPTEINQSTTMDEYRQMRAASGTKDQPHGRWGS